MKSPLQERYEMERKRGDIRFFVMLGLCVIVTGILVYRVMTEL
jgi:hypothetical protein